MIIRVNRQMVEGMLEGIDELIKFEREQLKYCIDTDNIAVASGHSYWLAYYKGQRNTLYRLLDNEFKEVSNVEP